MKFGFYTLGCKVNQYDTQLMKDLLEAESNTVVEFNETADCYIINTCTVTNMSDKKSRQMISRCKKLNPDAIIVVCGCFSQVSPQEVASLTGIDIVLGTANRKHISTYIKKFQKERTQIVAPADLKQETVLCGEEIQNFEDKTRAILKIEDGCQNYCSYCIIPFARGRIRSKQPDVILNEIRTLVQKKYKEIVLTGIHLASYGRDLENIDLADVICLANQENIERIRLGSLEPLIITEDFLSKIKDCEKLMPSFHLSLQSGSDTVLKRMNRHYTTEEYLNAVDLLRKHFPNCAVTTDIIVGFPGESEEEFEETLDFVDKVAFSKIHIFPYSMRKGTRAATMDGQIPANIKSERAKRLEIKELRLRLSFFKKQIGMTVPVLFEQKKENLWEGYTPNYLPVFVESDENLRDDIRQVVIKQANSTGLTGKLL